MVWRWGDVRVGRSWGGVYGCFLGLLMVVVFVFMIVCLDVVLEHCVVRVGELCFDLRDC